MAVNPVTASLQPTSGGRASLLGWKPNPFTDYIGSNRSALLGLAAGLVGGSTWGQGLSSGFQMAAQGRQMDQQQAEKLKAEAQAEKSLNATRDWLAQNYPDLAQAVDAGLPVSEAWNEAFRRKNAKVAADPYQERFAAGQNYGLTGDELNRFALTGDLPTGRGASAEVSLQPTWLVGPDGKPVLGQMTKGGEVIPSALPEGMTIMDPGMLAGSKTGATVDAKTAAAARAALPGAEQMMEITNKAISEVRNNAKGMNEWFSQWGPRGVYVNPGSDMGKFIAASSPTNAQAFMQARNMLKGGGQITDYEGRRAEDAISRMQAALDKGDQDQYLRALADFEQAVAEGYAKLKATAQGAYSAGSPAVGGQGGNRTSTGVTWSVEP